ncbi:putative powdery mildew-specific protein [Golovinomyces cichoracearum]|uniref:Putative powdery mildew-specific protein n=1 Tax=Golovinomyces cichoracearum TaxID=62708 RepID=A0A420HFG8_9PEZI|nr:putative powdery mildew-specific protein [Golovinomyces cichoracearum]
MSDQPSSSKTYGQASPVELPSAILKYKKYIDLDKWDDDELDLTDSNATSKTLQTYIVQRLSWYAEIEYTASRLWELFREDFSNWTPEMMNRCKVDILYFLRDSLTKNGVFVPRDNRRLAIRLLEVINEEQEHEWTQEEIEIQKSRGGGFSSKYNAVPSMIVQNTGFSISKVQRSRKPKTATTTLRSTKSNDSKSMHQPSTNPEKWERLLWNSITDKYLSLSRDTI